MVVVGKKQELRKKSFSIPTEDEYVQGNHGPESLWRSAFKALAFITAQSKNTICEHLWQLAVILVSLF